MTLPRCREKSRFPSVSSTPLLQTLAPWSPTQVAHQPNLLGTGERRRHSPHFLELNQSCKQPTITCFCKASKARCAMCHSAVQAPGSFKSSRLPSLEPPKSSITSLSTNMRYVPGCLSLLPAVTPRTGRKAQQLVSAQRFEIY